MSQCRSRRRDRSAGRGTLVALLVAAGAAVACGHAVADAVHASPRVIEPKALPDLQTVIPRLAAKRVVFIGEMHDRYEHHLAQLEIIRGLHAIDPGFAIGVEFFEQPVQPHLDAYIAGKLSETELLARTEYYARWGYDFRLYAPILAYAREHNIEIVALNLPREITRQVGRGGLASLTPEQRAQLPKEIDRSDDEYHKRLEGIFAEHPPREQSNFENFVDVQLLWDEAMAERAAAYLQQHPEQRLVVLAGNGHLAYGSGIPQRLLRRVPAAAAIVLNEGDRPPVPEIADFVVLAPPASLPAAGRLGIVLEESDGGVHVGSFAANSAAEAVGMKKGDRLLALDGTAIGAVADIRRVMWDKRPGDKVVVAVRRGHLLRAPEEMRYEVVLR